MPSHMFSLFIGVLTLASQRKHRYCRSSNSSEHVEHSEEISVIMRKGAQPMAPRHPSESYFFLSRAEVSGIYSLVLVAFTWTSEVISPYFFGVICPLRAKKGEEGGTRYGQARLCASITWITINVRSGHRARPSLAEVVQPAYAASL